MGTEESHHMFQLTHYQVPKGIQMNDIQMSQVFIKVDTRVKSIRNDLPANQKIHTIKP